MPTGFPGIEMTSHPCVLLRCFHDRQQTNHQSCHSPLLQLPAPTSQRDCHPPHGWETNVVSASYWWYHGHCWFCLCLSSICFLGNISMYQTRPKPNLMVRNLMLPIKILMTRYWGLFGIGACPISREPLHFSLLKSS